MKRWRTAIIFALGLAGLVLSVVLVPGIRVRATPLGRATVADRLAQYGPEARARLVPRFESQGVSYPPARLVILALKSERRLELYGPDASGRLKFIRAYPILRASGKTGPKLREGDGQVPEGIYRVESLNPNSRFHLSLRLNYPNEFDRRQAEREGRTSLGGDIMIHGGRASIGCLAMGDEAIEELFVLAAEAGIGNIAVLVCPADFREYLRTGPGGRTA